MNDPARRRFAGTRRTTSTSERFAAGGTSAIHVILTMAFGGWDCYADGMLAACVLAAMMGAPPPPVPVVVEVLSPRGAPWSERQADVVRLASLTARPLARLDLRPSERTGISRGILERCRAQPSLSCWTKAALGASGGASRVADVLLVRLLPVADPNRALVRIWLIDLERARSGLETVSPAQMDAWLRRNATRRRRLEVTWGDGALERGFEQLWASRAARYRRLGVWWPNGALRVDSEWLPPFVLHLNGEPVRTATAATVVVPQVAAGEHRVELVASEGRVARKVTVAAGQQAILHIESRPDAFRGDDRPALLWTGIGVAAVGVSIALTGALVPVESELVQVCPAGARCGGGSRFARSSDYFGARSAGDGGQGPLVVPLGYSLAIAGGAWALTALLSDDPDVPWWAVLIGSALGGTAYAISEAAQ